MATTAFGTNAAETNKVWAKLADAVALPKTSLGHASGKGMSNIVQMRDELKKGRGDRVRYFLRQLATGDGVVEGETLEGSEESVDYQDDELYINQLRHAVRFENENISEQRVLLDVRTDGKNLLSEWLRDRFDRIYFNHLCGNTAIEQLAKPSKFNGFNTIVDYHADRTVRAGGDANDQTLNGNSSNTFNLGLIDVAVERAKTADVPLRPISVGGQELYVMYLHPYQVTDLRDSNSEWYANMRAAMQGGAINENPIFTGALGVHNGVVLIENNRVTTGVHSSTGAVQSNVRRAVLAGAQACTMAFGRYGSTDPEKLQWTEQRFDYDEEVGIAIKTIFGLKRNRFNGLDYGSIVVPTYAVAATS